MDHIIEGNARDFPLFGPPGTGFGSNHGLQMISQDILNSIPVLLPATPMPHVGDSPLPDDNTNTSSESELELRLEELLNSSSTGTLLDNMNYPSLHDHNDVGLPSKDLINILDTSVDSLDEFPLFTHPLGNTEIIENEVVLSSPVRILPNYKEKNEEEEELEEVENTQEPKKHTKSKIPLPTHQMGIRRSKRFMNLNLPERKFCDPKVFDIPLKSVIKSKETLNLIVDSSSGQLTDATKYATELNSVNSEGILIPTDPDEVVTVPVRGNRKTLKNPKTALVKAYQYKVKAKTMKSPAKIGFYSHAQYKKYCASPSKVVKSESPAKKVKQFRWANELEW